MMHLKYEARLILEAVQMGGTMTFLTDQAPENLTDWMSPLLQNFAGDIPFVKRSAQDLISGKFETQAQDLIFLWSSQLDLLQDLNAVLQGQRVLFGSENLQESPFPADYLWSPGDLDSWRRVLAQVRAMWGRAKSVDDIKDSFKSPCLFLDRDDVVVRNVPYNKDPEKVELMPGIEELINEAHDKGYWVALVTNQSGLGRGLISWTEYQKVHQRTLKLLAGKGCWLDESVWAGFIPQEEPPQGRLLASFRKPRGGMFQLVNTKLKAHLPSSVMVGDSASDLIAAHGLGIKNLYLLGSSKLEKEKKSLQQFQKTQSDFEFRVAETLSDVKLSFPKAE